MPRLRVVALFALLGACLAMPAAAQWKWRDKGGQIQYSDLPPPPGVSEHDILQRPSAARRVAAASAPTASASGLNARVVEPELEAKRRKAEQEAADRSKAEDARIAATKADNCGRARSYLKALDDGMRVARTDAKGEREVLDDKARADESRHAREVISSECK